MSDKHEKILNKAQEETIDDSFISNIEPGNEGDRVCFEPDMNVMADIYGPEPDIEWIDDAVLIWNEFEMNNEDKGPKNSNTNLLKQDALDDKLFEEREANDASSQSKITARSTQNDRIISTKKVNYESLDDFLKET